MSNKSICPYCTEHKRRWSRPLYFHRDSLIPLCPMCNGKGYIEERHRHYERREDMELKSILGFPVTKEASGLNIGCISLTKEELVPFIATLRKVNSALASDDSIDVRRTDVDTHFYWASFGELAKELQSLLDAKLEVPFHERQFSVMIKAPDRDVQWFHNRTPTYESMGALGVATAPLGASLHHLMNFRDTLTGVSVGEHITYRNFIPYSAGPGERLPDGYKVLIVRTK